jgi:hypothetical protein
MAPIAVTAIAAALLGAAACYFVVAKSPWIASVTAPGAGMPRSISPDAFPDGIGFYFFNDGKYNFLTWRSKLYTPRMVPDEKAIQEIAGRATPVKKEVRFFSYGVDIATWPGVPPYLMAFCIVRDAKKIDGIYPIRIKPVQLDRSPIYELLLPPMAESLRSGNSSYLFWAINFQYSCTDGWTFRFEQEG